MDLNARRTPSQHRSLHLVNSVLQAGQELFARGLTEGGVSVSRIAARAGVSAGSIYQYFATKEQMIRAMSMERINKHLNVLRGRKEEFLSLPLDEGINQLIRTFADLYLQHPTLLRNLMRFGPEWKRLPEVKAARQRIAKIMVDRLKSENGRVEGRNPEVVVFVLMQSVIATLQAAVEMEGERSFTDDELKSELVRLCRAFVAPEDRRPADS